MNVIGRPEELATAAIRESLPVWAKLQSDLASALESAKTFEEANRVIDAWAAEIASNDELADTIFRVALHADLAGQLFVRTIELPELDPMRALDDRPVPPFLRLTFAEALRLFLDRKILTPAQFQALSDEQRTQAYTATLLASDALRTRARDLLAAAMRDGTTLRQFINDMHAEELSLGVTPSDPWYLETVFRTNLANSYGAGRYRQITSDVVKAARPYVQFRATGDNRTTDICAFLHGTVFSQDDPNWQQFAPPLHFNCRSVIVARKDLPPGVQVTDASTITFKPQKGFRSPPTL